MKFLVLFALACTTVSTKDLYFRSIEVPVIENEGRITNGKKASPGQFPYQVGLYLNKSPNSKWCGGSFIGNNWILTAAHCTHGASFVRVYLGATKRLAAEKVYNVSGNDVIIHTDWDPKTLYNDISLIRIPKTSETDRIQIVRIPSNYDNRKYVGYVVVISGWGFINDETEEISNDLEYGILKVSPGSVCSEFYIGDFSDDIFICVATPKRVSSCHGDSGSPLVLYEQNLQIGLASFVSRKGCAKEFPTAYIRVSAYLPWIKSHTGIDYNKSKL